MSETRRCPFCQNIVSAVIEHDEETIYRHSNSRQRDCVDHGNGKVSMTWDKDTLLSIMRNAEIGTHYNKAVSRGDVEKLIDNQKLRESWDGENTDVLPMTRYSMNGYDARLTEQDIE